MPAIFPFIWIPLMEEKLSGPELAVTKIPKLRNRLESTGRLVARYTRDTGAHEIFIYSS